LQQINNSHCLLASIV